MDGVDDPVEGDGLKDYREDVAEGGAVEEKETDEDILKEARARFKRAFDADEDDRSRAKDEIRFAWNIKNAQWDQEAATLRKGRPMLTENRLPSFVRQAVNDIRQSRPAGRVLPVDSKGDKFTASVLEGLVRNIESGSRADMSYDNAVTFAAFCGRGYWKITREYLEDSFDQDIVISPVANPFSIWDDPDCKLPDKSDRKFLFEGEWVKNDEFKDEVGEAPEAFDDMKGTLGDDAARWVQDEETLLAIYWRIRCDYETLYQFDDGTVTKDPAGHIAQWQRQNAQMVAMMAAQLEQQVQAAAQSGGDPSAIQVPQAPAFSAPKVVRTRRQERKRAQWFRMSGTKIYDRGEWGGRYIPVVYVCGEQITIEGESHTKGMTQDAQDLTKANNYILSAQMEGIALSPKIPFIGPKGAFKTDNAKWNSANQVSYAYIEYDGTTPPSRSDGITVQPELSNVKGAVVDGMRSVIGLQGASLGDQGPETAWRAIQARQSEGDTAVFHLMDNLVRAVRYSGMVIIDVAPVVYDTKRMLRIINPENKPTEVAINQLFNDESGKPVEVNFAKGKYDFAVSAGPAFETQRQQTAATLVDLSNRNPQLFGAAGDIVVKSLALPQAEELAERLKRGIPPHILGEGPSQQEQQLQGQIQQMQQQLQEAGTNLQMLQSELAKQAASLAGKQVDYNSKVAKLEADLAQARIDQETARLDLAKKEAELAITYAKAMQSAAENSVQIQTDNLVGVVQQLLSEQELKVRGLVPQLDAPPPQDMSPLFDSIAKSNAQLQEAIAALTAATLAPKESRVMTPDGREFRSLSSPVLTPTKQ